MSRLVSLPRSSAGGKIAQIHEFMECAGKISGYSLEIFIGDFT